LAEALKRMKQECDESGRQDVWRTFDGRILRPALQFCEAARDRL
jgi:hypothetical protein